MNKGQRIATVILAIAILMIITGVSIEVRDMIIDHECSTMSVNEMLTNNRCEKYKNGVFEK